MLCFCVSMAKFIFFFILLTTQYFLFAHSRQFPSSDNGIDVYNVVDFGAAGDGTTDDTQAFTNAWEATCNSSSSSPTMQVPEGKSFLLQPLTFYGKNCTSNNITFQIDGGIIAPSDPDTWNKCRNGKNCRQWIQFHKFDGLTIRGLGSINGNGSSWWDLKCKQDKNVCGKKPTAVVVSHSNNVHIDQLTFKDSPKMHVALERSTNIYATNLTIKAPGDSPNTDGIHIQHSSNVSVDSCSISTGDDCVSIGDGSSRLNIQNVLCGPGHGISVGSLGVKGKYETVEYVHVSNVTFTGTENGVRIKTWQGGEGYAKHITFENILFRDSNHPVIIDQYYCPHAHCKNKTSAVQISDVTYNQIYGTSSKEIAVDFACSRSTPCRNIIMKDINLQHIEPEKNTSSYCLNVEGVENSRVFPTVSCLNVDDSLNLNL